MKTKTFVGAFDRLPDGLDIDNLNEHLILLEEIMKGEVEGGALKKDADEIAKQRRPEFLKSQVTES